MKKHSIIVKGLSIRLMEVDTETYISLTDIARNKNPNEPKDVVKNWMRTRSTIEFLALWEKLNNPDFKGGEIDPFQLNETAIQQMKSLLRNTQIKKLK